jgi:hypothetical protein
MQSKRELERKSAEENERGEKRRNKCSIMKLYMVWMMMSNGIK